MAPAASLVLLRGREKNGPNGLGGNMSVDLNQCLGCGAGT